MAVVHDADSNSGEVTATSATWAHTVTGSSTGIRVSVHWTSGADPTGVTFNGVALTHVGGDSASGKKVDHWFLAGAATGTHDIVVTFAASTNFVAAASSFTGVDQGTPTSGFTSAQGFDATPTLAVTSAVGDMVVDGTTPSGAATAAGGQTEEYNVFTASIPAMGSRKGGAASVTMAWTAPNNAWTIAAFNIKAAAAGPTAAQEMPAIYQALSGTIIGRVDA